MISRESSGSRSSRVAGTPPPMPTPGKRKWIAWIVAGLVCAVAIVALVLLPRSRAVIEGRPLAEWLADLPSIDSSGIRETLATHPTTQTLRRSAPAILPALEREFGVASRQLLSERARFMRNAQAWAWILRILPSNVRVAPPSPKPEIERAIAHRMTWAAALLVLLQEPTETRLNRLDVVLSDRPAPLAIEASQAFAALQDRDGSLSRDLAGRITSGPPARRAFWLSCLGYLGPQATHNAPLVRGCIEDPDPEVRSAAIQALASLDPSESVVAFLQTRTVNTSDRRAVMLAFSRIGPAARAAEPLIRATLADSDLLTSMFAKMALDRVCGTNSGAATPNP